MALEDLLLHPLALGAAGWAAMLATSVARQERLIFGRPWRIRPVPPGPHAGSHQVRALDHHTADGERLEGWLATPDSGAAPRGLLLYFGGRNENAAWSPGMAGWLGRDWAVRACNYRGFAGSTGHPSEQTAVADGLDQGRAALQALGLPASALVVAGRSLGSAVAIQVAAQLPGARLVLLTPPKSMAAIVARRLLLAPALPLLRNRFDSIGVAPQIRSPSLVVLAARDAMVPHADSRALAASLGGPVTLETIPGTGHLSLPRHPLTQALLARWVRETGG